MKTASAAVAVLLALAAAETAWAQGSDVRSVGILRGVGSTGITSVGSHLGRFQNYSTGVSSVVHKPAAPPSASGYSYSGARSIRPGGIGRSYLASDRSADISTSGGGKGGPSLPSLNFGGQRGPSGDGQTDLLTNAVRGLEPRHQPLASAQAPRDDDEARIEAFWDRYGKPFDLPSQLQANPSWNTARELLSRGRFAEAVQEIRLGLVIGEACGEGEWLMAVAQVGLDNAGEAVVRLRNAMALSPDLLAKPRGVGDLVGPGTVERWIASTEGAESAGTERRLAAAWLAMDRGEPARAVKLLSKVSEASGAAVTVAWALDGVLEPPAAKSVDAATSTMPPATGNAPPPMTIEQWFSARGPTLGLPADNERYVAGPSQPAAGRP